MEEYSNKGKCRAPIQSKDITLRCASHQSHHISIHTLPHLHILKVTFFLHGKPQCTITDTSIDEKRRLLNWTLADGRRGVSLIAEMKPAGSNHFPPHSPVKPRDARNAAQLADHTLIQRASLAPKNSYPYTIRHVPATTSNVPSNCIDMFFISNSTGTVATCAWPLQNITFTLVPECCRNQGTSSQRNRNQSHGQPA